MVYSSLLIMEPRNYGGSDFALHSCADGDGVVGSLVYIYKLV